MAARLRSEQRVSPTSRFIRRVEMRSSPLSGLWVVGLLTLLASALSLDAQSLVLASEREAVRLIAEVAGDVWLAGDSGAYRLENQDRELILREFRVYAISNVGGDIWLGSEGGLFRVEEGSPQPILREELGVQNITDIASYEGVVFVGTNRGLWTIEDGVASRSKFGFQVHYLIENGGEIWVATRGNAFRLNKGGVVSELFKKRVDVPAIIKTSSSLWLIVRELGPSSALYVVNDDKPVLVYPQEGELYPEFEVISVGEFGGGVYLGTTLGLYQLTESLKPIQVDFPREPVTAIQAVGDRVYVGTTRGVYVKSGESFSAIQVEEPLNVKEIVHLAGKTWVRTTTGVFRVKHGASKFEVVWAWAVAVVLLALILSFIVIYRRRLKSKSLI